MPLSARNRIAGVVKGIEKGEVAAKVKIEISNPVTITSMITKEAAEELGLKEGDKVEAVIKASDVMVSKD
jgi:molybdopterin-binding protein